MNSASHIRLEGVSPYDITPCFREDQNYQLACRSFNPKEIIYSQKTPVVSFCSLCKGEVKIVYRALNGQKFILDFVKAGKIVGIESLFLEEHIATAEITEKAKLCFLPKHALLRLMGKHTSFQQSTLRNWNQIYTMLFRRALVRIHSGSEAALAQSLLQLAHCEDSQSGEFVTIKRSIYDLADYSFLSHRTTFRALRSIKKKGAINRLRQRELVLNIQELKSICPE